MNSSFKRDGCADLRRYAIHRFTQGCTAASDAGDDAAGSGTIAVRGGPPPGGDRLGRVAMGESPQPRRRGGAAGQAPSGTHAQAERPPTSTPGEGAAARAARARLSDRVVDAESRHRSDRETLGRDVRPLGRLACAASHGMELPEARSPNPDGIGTSATKRPSCGGARRTGHA